MEYAIELVFHGDGQIRYVWDSHEAWVKHCPRLDGYPPEDELLRTFESLEGGRKLVLSRKEPGARLASCIMYNGSIAMRIIRYNHRHVDAAGRRINATETPASEPPPVIHTEGRLGFLEETRYPDGAPKERLEVAGYDRVRILFDPSGMQTSYFLSINKRPVVFTGGKARPGVYVCKGYDGPVTWIFTGSELVYRERSTWDLRSPALLARAVA